MAKKAKPIDDGTASEGAGKTGMAKTIGELRASLTRGQHPVVVLHQVLDLLDDIAGKVEQ